MLRFPPPRHKTLHEPRQEHSDHPTRMGLLDKKNGQKKTAFEGCSKRVLRSGSSFPPPWRKSSTRTRSSRRQVLKTCVRGGVPNPTTDPYPPYSPPPRTKFITGITTENPAAQTQPNAHTNPPRPITNTRAPTATGRAAGPQPRKTSGRLLNNSRSREEMGGRSYFVSASRTQYSGSPSLLLYQHLSRGKTLRNTFSHSHLPSRWRPRMPRFASPFPLHQSPIPRARNGGFEILSCRLF
jgi:hypothetical protein